VRLNPFSLDMALSWTACLYYFRADGYWIAVRPLAPSELPTATSMTRKRDDSTEGSRRRREQSSRRTRTNETRPSRLLWLLVGAALGYGAGWWAASSSTAVPPEVARWLTLVAAPTPLGVIVAAVILVGLGVRLRAHERPAVLMALVGIGGIVAGFLIVMSLL